MKKNLFFIFLIIILFFILLYVILYNLQIQENFGLFDGIVNQIVQPVKSKVNEVNDNVNAINNIPNTLKEAAKDAAISEASKYVTNPGQYLTNESVKDIINNPSNLNNPSLKSAATSLVNDYSGAAYDAASDAGYGASTGASTGAGTGAGTGADTRSGTGSGTGASTGSGTGSQTTTRRPKVNHNVTRQNFTINGKTYTGTHKTPCFNKTDDFNEWCRNYLDKNNVSVASGNNMSNMGVKNILVGTDGECGNSNLAQGICDFNYFDQINKLNHQRKCDSIYNEDGSNNCSELDYNLFTDCLHPTATLQDYKTQCDQISGTPGGYSPIKFAGYDCNPGYFRAKCVSNINYSDSMSDNNLYASLGGNNLPPQEKCNNCSYTTTPSSA